jgi:GNAT superfamily N-acetyltransferase
MPDELVFRVASGADWAALRDLRLEMLEDEPLAFLERLDDARRLGDADWRRRAERRDHDRLATFVAELPDGRLVGQMGGHAPEDGSGPWLVAVYVTPDFRGRRHGVADALLDAVEHWAAQRAPILRLEVNEQNPRARAFYGARGYVDTGGRRPYPLDPALQEIEMLKRL